MATGDILAQVADQRTVEEIKNSIGETDDTGGSTVAGTAMAKMNKAIEDTGLINESIKDIVSVVASGIFEKDVPGTYSVKLSPITTQIKVTACGAGGGGGGGGVNDHEKYAGGGGGGGAAIVNKVFTVPKGATLSVTVGKGGIANYTADGKAGEATIIKDVVTLAGGKGGKSGYKSTAPVAGGAAGGTGGGKGGDSGQDGSPGVLGAGGKGSTGNWNIGGGGGSIGNGGSANQVGTRGGGGGGSAYRDAAKGGDGYVKIEW